MVAEIVPSVLPEGARDLPGWPGYRVDPRGGVWSCCARGNNRDRLAGLDFLPWRELGFIVAGPRGARRLRVGLTVAGGQQFRDIDVLILSAFAGPRPAGMRAAHLNGDLTDNRLENLAWAPGGAAP